MPGPGRWPIWAAVLPLAAAAALALALAARYLPGEAQAGRGPIDWAEMLAEALEAGPQPPAGPWTLDLPRDHGAHPGARTEAWTIAAQLRTGAGEAVGLQLALLRVALPAPGAAEAASPFALGALHRGHVTLLRGTGGQAAGEERFQRELAGLAGHDPARRELRLDRWSLGYGAGAGGAALRLEASVGRIEISLFLAPVKAAVPVDPGGAGAPFRGYALTRMQATGAIAADGRREPVAGLAWLDHLWGDVPLPVGPVVSDRLQLQLDDGTDLLLTRTRRRDGSGTPTLAGFVVDASGAVLALPAEALAMEPTQTWRRSRAGSVWPVDWRLTAGPLALELAPLADDQLHDFVAPIWSGPVEAEGMHGDRPVAGSGTLLLMEGTPP